MEKEIFCEKLLELGSEIKPVAPRDSLFKAIEHRIATNKYYERKTKWYVAASLFFVISTPILVAQQTDELPNALEQVANEMAADNQFYK